VVRTSARAPVERRVEAAQAAQEQPQRGALLLVGERDRHRRAGRLHRARDRVGAGADHLVVAGEEAREQVAGGLVARQPGVEAAEHELDDLARDLRRDDPLRRRVERADVQGARVAQRDARDARRERLVHVADVERGALEQVLDGARDVDRHRGAGAPGQRRQRLADREHAGLAVVAEQVARAHRAAALADELV
jgi:hypothetical protein